MDPDPDSQKPRNRGGRPPFEPTAEQRRLCEAMAGLLVPHETICDLMGGISPMTLRKHFRKELDHGRERIKARLKDTLLRQAMNGKVRALTFLIDRLCPELPRPAVRVEGNDGPPLTQTIIIRGGLGEAIAEMKADGHDAEPLADGGNEVDGLRPTLA